MKKLCKILLLFCIIATSCDINSENGLKLSTDFLKQTSWEGLLTNQSSDLEREITLQFVTADRGYYESKNPYDDNVPGMRDEFTYTVDDKLLVIICPHGLSGDWILTEIGKDKLVLKRDIYTENSDILNLTKTR